ncbi:UbiA family prenyltransferase, partial [Xanthovirga aplysinae]|uniref:UbiA family prenyltransferase n=1 Tax=Xanthovirga aplysinae TaxID=2529853 RepID=UPI0012BD5D0B
MKKATLLHLRIPFSFFLLPVYGFACSLSPSLAIFNVFLIFVILHFLLYPASNGYNSYFDKDQDSIGGLENPPPVSKELYFVALILDTLAIILGLLISITFAVMLFIYGMVSKAYSHPVIRLKKYPITSWLIAGFFQGFFTFLMVWMALNPTENFSTVFRTDHVLIPAFLSSFLLWASYPLTQVYQHAEDARRGDQTLSLWLGIRKTFYFSAI